MVRLKVKVSGLFIYSSFNSNSIRWLLIGLIIYLLIKLFIFNEF